MPADSSPRRLWTGFTALLAAGLLFAWCAGHSDLFANDVTLTFAPYQQPAEAASQPTANPADEIKALKARLDVLEKRDQERTRAEQKPEETTTAAGDKTTSSPQASADQDSTPKMEASWLHGLIFASPKSDFRVHVGGQLQADVGWAAANQAVQFGPGGTGEIPDGAQLRRAALRVDGTMYSNVEWVLNVGFTGSFDNDSSPAVQPVGTITFQEASATLKELPTVGNLRVGFFKEPFGFNHLISSNWLNFMERQPGGDASGLISPGAMFFDWAKDESRTWAIGVFHPTNNNFGFGVGDGELAVTGRVTWLPVDADNGERLLHLGIAATDRSVADGQIDFRARPDVRTAPSTLEPDLATTGTIDATTQQAFNAELAAVYGPWTLQSEYYCTFLHNATFPADPPPTGIPRGTLFYQGAYVEVLYFLTGEHQPYDRKKGLFDRVAPLSNFRFSEDCTGLGAWQVGLRYSYLDLQSHDVNGATLNDVTLGLNWILNPNTRVQWNLGIDHRDSTPAGSDGWTYVFGMRFAVDF